MDGDAAEDVWPRRVVWLRRWMAVCWLALLAATWRLWTPQTVFPQIPFFGWLREVPGWVDWVAVGGLIAGVTGLLFAPHDRWRSGSGELRDRRGPLPDGRGSEESRRDGRGGEPLTPGPSPQGEGGKRGRMLRAASLLAVGATVVLVLLNQHRLQVWAYQFVVVAVVLGFTSAGRGASLLRVLTVGIYFWSAVSKLDYTFLHGLGLELLWGTLGAFGLEPRFMRPEVATAIAWAFPLDELAVAVLLAVRRTRTIGLVGAVAMHGLLLAGLGPLGLDHSWGVLLWNVYFLWQDVLLFRRPAAGWRSAAGPAAGLRSAAGPGVWGRFAEVVRGVVPRRGAMGVGEIAVYLAVWLPVLEPFGWLDHWPGWAVYAPAGERVTLLVPMDAGKSRGFDQWEKHYFGVAVFGAPWGLRDDLWSLETLSTPTYPQARFRAGVALAAVERGDLETVATLVVTSRPDRLTGVREKTTYSGDSIRHYAESFRLNALPRKIGGW